MTLQSLDNKVIEEFGWIGDIQAKIKAAAAKVAATTRAAAKAAPTQKGWKPPASQKTKTDDSDSAF